MQSWGHLHSTANCRNTYRLLPYNIYTCCYYCNNWRERRDETKSFNGQLDTYAVHEYIGTKVLTALCNTSSYPLLKYNPGHTFDKRHYSRSCSRCYQQSRHFLEACQGVRHTEKVSFSILGDPQ